MKLINAAIPMNYYRQHADSIIHRLLDRARDNHNKTEQRYLHTCFGIDTQDDVVGILTRPHYHPVLRHRMWKHQYSQGKNINIFQHQLTGNYKPDTVGSK